MNGSAFISEIESIPDLMRDRHTGFSDQAGDLAKLFSEDYKISQVLLTGCGDSHHAAVATRLAFQQLTDLPYLQALYLYISPFLLSRKKIYTPV